ncbi:MAG TPA: sirohydrochlorin nickelochelatase [Methanomicrobiales archaeon]|nr:sirohydrochlorin nickelochelatase [Methanomicrobiales archaeon]
MSKKGLLLVGHGSSLPYNKQLVEDTARMVSRRDPGYLVKCAFMNLNTPTIGEALEEFKREDVDTVIVVPLFLARGVHINRDIPEVLGLPEGSYRGSLQKNGSSIPLIYADPIGSDPLLAELMLKNAARALRERL